mmetsp:Transcript_11274/g.27750  ORF Transcript_11274/g.27750 Transcript_11274/m.27750 type:complete len:105 (+) Transcript_11274:113-427(+)
MVEDGWLVSSSTIDTLARASCIKRTNATMQRCNDAAHSSYSICNTLILVILHTSPVVDRSFHKRYRKLYAPTVVQVEAKSTAEILDRGGCKTCHVRVIHHHLDG